MASKEHVAILLQGVQAWNKWRMDNPDIKPDLSGFNGETTFINEETRIEWPQKENKYDLTKINFSDANLNNVKFDTVDFSGANFQRASLESAQIIWSKLYKANLAETAWEQGAAHGSDFSHADLSNAQWKFVVIGLGFNAIANFSRANLTDTAFVGCTIFGGLYTGAQLIRTQFWACTLDGSLFKGAHFGQVVFRRSSLVGASFLNTDMTDSNLMETHLIRTDFSGADISGSKIYGLSAWDVVISKKTRMSGLKITKTSDPDGFEDDEEQTVVTVDDIEVGQFINLLMNNAKIRSVIDTLTSKVVLILGRFTEKRKTVLDAIRTQLYTMI